MISGDIQLVYCLLWNVDHCFSLSSLYYLTSTDIFPRVQVSFSLSKYFSNMVSYGVNRSIIATMSYIWFMFFTPYYFIFLFFFTFYTRHYKYFLDFFSIITLFIYSFFTDTVIYHWEWAIYVRGVVKTPMKQSRTKIITKTQTSQVLNDLYSDQNPLIERRTWFC